jgi:hypothetical protein
MPSLRDLTTLCELVRALELVNIPDPGEVANQKNLSLRS